jgi:Protein of unknown function (DUF2771)
VVRRLLLVAAVLLVAGCGTGDPPQITFTAAGATVTARPTQYCDIKLADCADDAAAPVQLAVPAGSPLQVAVPDGVSEAPWHIVFSYRNAGGEQVDARSPVFPAKQRGDYTLELPAPTDRLLTAQVQQFGPAPRINEETGEIEFPVRGSWVLTASGT